MARNGVGLIGEHLEGQHRRDEVSMNAEESVCVQFCGQFLKCRMRKRSFEGVKLITKQI